jgi:hypothetical protein
MWKVRRAIRPEIDFFNPTYAGWIASGIYRPPQYPASPKQTTGQKTRFGPRMQTALPYSHSCERATKILKG